ncbi:hypothetical protein EsH8_V_001109 [Colletotrichum jinshuiense]
MSPRPAVVDPTGDMVNPKPGFSDPHHLPDKYTQRGSGQHTVSESELLHPNVSTSVHDPHAPSELPHNGNEPPHPQPTPTDQQQRVVAVDVQLAALQTMIDRQTLLLEQDQQGVQRPERLGLASLCFIICLGRVCSRTSLLLRVISAHVPGGSTAEIEELIREIEGSVEDLQRLSVYYFEAIEVRS